MQEGDWTLGLSPPGGVALSAGQQFPLSLSSPMAGYVFIHSVTVTGPERQKEKEKQ